MENGNTKPAGPNPGEIPPDPSPAKSKTQTQLGGDRPVAKAEACGESTDSVSATTAAAATPAVKSDGAVAPSPSPATSKYGFRGYLPPGEAPSIRATPELMEAHRDMRAMNLLLNSFETSVKVTQEEEADEEDVHDEEVDEEEEVDESTDEDDDDNDNPSSEETWDQMYDQLLTLFEEHGNTDMDAHRGVHCSEELYQWALVQVGDIERLTADEVTQLHRLNFFGVRPWTFGRCKHKACEKFAAFEGFCRAHSSTGGQSDCPSPAVASGERSGAEEGVGESANNEEDNAQTSSTSNNTSEASGEAKALLMGMF